MNRQKLSNVVNVLNVIVLAIMTGQFILGNYSIVITLYLIVLLLNMLSFINFFFFKRKISKKIIDTMFDDAFQGTADVAQNKFGDILILIVGLLSTVFWPIGSVINMFSILKPKYVKMIEEEDNESN